MPHSVLLIITGSIAAYKTPDLVRRLREQGIAVTCVLTRGGGEFVTPLTLAALSERPVYQELFSLDDEQAMGHIRLAREHDVILVAPASADRLAKMASGHADDLAGAVLLAASVPVLVAPAMNRQMWAHKTVQRNLAQLQEDGVSCLMPEAGELACGEVGAGRLAATEMIVHFVQECLRARAALPLAGRKAIVTSGPTHEPIDPVRFIGNRSSGKQGHAFARALQQAGASVTLITGPVAVPPPYGVEVQMVETAHSMQAACEQALPADIFIAAAAVSDWRSASVLDHKIKKRANATPPEITLALNPDILHHIANHPTHRPALVVGFAAETEALLENATEKRASKGCDWIIANDVQNGALFGADHTQATLITADETTLLPGTSKMAVAEAVTQHISHYFTKEAS